MKYKSLANIQDSIKNHNILKFIIIPFFLVVFWILSATVFVPGSSFSIIPSYYSQKNFNGVSYTELLKGQKIIGEIKANENNFGIILLRLTPSINVSFENEDQLIFRIKEKGKNMWIAQNKYKSGIFKNFSLFPFGFPKIANSNGKTYDFEVISLRGNEDNAIALSKHKPNLIAQYKFSRNEILANPKTFLLFLIKKIIKSFSNFEFVLSSVPYALPLIFYSIWLIFEKKINKAWLRMNKLLNIKKYILLHTVFSFILFDLLVNYTDLTYALFIIFLFFWIISLIIYKLDSSVTILYSTIFFVISVIAIILKNIYLTDKASSLFYLFILVASLQMIFETRKIIKKRVDYKIFLKDTFILK